MVDEQRTRADYYRRSTAFSRAAASPGNDRCAAALEYSHLGGQPRAGIAATLFGVKPASTKDQPNAGETSEQSRTIDRFLDNLTISPIRNSRLVDIKYQLADPELAMRVVNAIAKNYIDQNLEYKFTASKEASDWLGDRLAEQRRQVETAETALQRYREQHDAIFHDHENIVVRSCRI